MTDQWLRTCPDCGRTLSLTRGGARLPPHNREAIRGRNADGTRQQSERCPGSRTRVEDLPCCESHVPAPPDGQLYPAPWLGEGRVIASCCDPDDCGPCCANCPTCPTEANRRSSAATAETGA